MGMGMRIMVLMFVLSFVLYWGTPAHDSTMFTSLLSGSLTSFNAQFLILLGFAGAVGIAAGLFGVSPSYALFTGIATFLLSFFTLPTAVFVAVEIPADIKLLLAGVFGIMYMSALLNWFKGVGDW